MKEEQMSNNEEKISQIMALFSGIEKKLLEMFIATGEEQEKIKLIHPFFFERVMDYCRRNIPEQEKTVYPLFLTELEKVPQLMQAFQGFVITVVKKANEEGLKTIDLDYAKKCALNSGYSPVYVDEILKKDSDFAWSETIKETQLLIDEFLDDGAKIGKELVDKKEITNLKKELNNKTNDETLEYLGKTKVLFGFLTYINEIAGRKEFFDYIGDNIMGEIILKEYNRDYAQKIISQVNYFLSKDKK